MSALHPIFEQALAPFLGQPSQVKFTEAEWEAADLEALRKKQQDPFRERDMHKRIAEQNDWLRATGGLL